MHGWCDKLVLSPGRRFMRHLPLLVTLPFRSSPCRSPARCLPLHSHLHSHLHSFLLRLLRWIPLFRAVPHLAIRRNLRRHWFAAPQLVVRALRSCIVHWRRLPLHNHLHGFLLRLRRWIPLFRAVQLAPSCDLARRCELLQAACSESALRVAMHLLQWRRLWTSLTAASTYSLGMATYLLRRPNHTHFPDRFLRPRRASGSFEMRTMRTLDVDKSIRGYVNKHFLAIV